ncbi:MAG: hypothetical protein UV64_C0016G0015 [Parcubacteria group bacterium GW2011_GWC1_43_11b]|uniref:Uncharacterized protein n=1 Tax=Candidatus Vogelbacteria bacterium RIFOXYB1_FULL_42_16 TaxID=1802436 RepID=A0A1G2QEA8_9BACT|nr:MAG: hypothetical protein UV50_C0010G0020 [Parcubacteria group bacterium GW2011_GWB1_42_9]KKS88961.1 MAG: hypothetical protein UV64_C0016G0015 [Parcubacteria group bacterium GW2011_GWC1_43_11b]KKT09379.1 MAG: hypothetical protein UV88_C0011G0023 [Parcubacteria group bacterium GW2011_GWA1_43_21]OHA58753.1 MAG: hypothetical protein A2370_02190 [Candidatus Vogelbacteria bacterium RIFOXYB1_FULL_42_16]
MNLFWIWVVGTVTVSTLLIWVAVRIKTKRNHQSRDEYLDRLLSRLAKEDFGSDDGRVYRSMEEVNSVEVER